MTLKEQEQDDVEGQNDANDKAPTPAASTQYANQATPSDNGDAQDSVSTSVSHRCFSLLSFTNA